MLRNPRTLINQLRVAYFVPNRNRLTCTRYDYRVQNTCTSSSEIHHYGMSDFCTPVVPFCCQIPFVQAFPAWNDWGFCQSVSLVHQVRPTDEQLKDLCYPSVRHAKGGNFIVDCSSLFRCGLYNGFHNTSSLHESGWSYRKPMINLFI